MCRTTGLVQQQPYDDRLKIKAFHLRISPSSSSAAILPDSLTLVFLPRINASLLEVNGSKIRPDSPAFLTLHRLLNSAAGDVVFGSNDRVRAADGVIFELHVGEGRLLKGVFRRHDDEISLWRMDCKCILEREFAGVGLREAEVSVAAEGGGVMREKVEVAVAKRWKFETGLEEIPEERERDVDEEGSDAACCCCCRGEDEFDDDIKEMEMETEGVRWAVDVGIWVVCLGVGYLVSRASARKLMRTKFIR